MSTPAQPPAHEAFIALASHFQGRIQTVDQEGATAQEFLVQINGSANPQPILAKHQAQAAYRAAREHLTDPNGATVVFVDIPPDRAKRRRSVYVYEDGRLHNSDGEVLWPRKDDWPESVSRANHHNQSELRSNRKATLSLRTIIGDLKVFYNNDYPEWHVRLSDELTAIFSAKIFGRRIGYDNAVKFAIAYQNERLYRLVLRVADHYPSKRRVAYGAAEVVLNGELHPPRPNRAKLHNEVAVLKPLNTNYKFSIQGPPPYRCGCQNFRSEIESRIIRLSDHVSKLCRHTLAIKFERALNKEANQ